MKTEVTQQVAYATPPVAVAALTMNEAVALATLFYIILQAAYLGWKWYQEYKKTKGS